MTDSKKKGITNKCEATTKNQSHMVKKGQKMAYNISPGITRQYLDSKSYLTRIKLFVKYWTLFFENFEGISEYKFYFECGEHGLYHWHGTMVVSDVKSYYYSLAKLWYTMKDVNSEIKPITDEAGWDEYITKDYKVWHIKICNKRQELTILDYM